jgi:hypothetical protein
MVFFYKVFSHFSRFSKKEFRDEKRNSILRKAFGTGSLDISARYFDHCRLSKCRLYLPC